MIRILHISDIHLTQLGSPIWGADVKLNFDSAIKFISEIKLEIDAIFITGDLSNDGSIESYKYIDAAFASIGVPTYCCMGNHDNIDHVLSVFSSGFINYCPIAYVADWKFLILNSIVPDEEDLGKNKARGYLSETSLKFLESSITLDKRNTAIVLHHPPIEPGGWLNRKLLDNRDIFNKLIRKYEQVKLVLYGHTHYNLQTSLDGILYTSASSIGFAFDKELPKFEIAQGQEGFNVYEICNDNIFCKSYHNFI